MLIEVLRILFQAAAPRSAKQFAFHAFMQVHSMRDIIAYNIGECERLILRCSGEGDNVHW